MKPSIIRKCVTSLAALPILWHSAYSFLQPQASRATFNVATFSKTGGNFQSLTLPSCKIRRTSLRAAEVSEKSEKSEENEERDDDSNDKPENAKKPKVEISDNPVSKFRKLKDIMWIREAVEDLTAAEFACSIESKQEISDKKQKRAVDYEKLLSQLNRRIGDLVCLPYEEINGSIPEIEENLGMGRFVYTEAQRTALLIRIIDTREKVLEVTKSDEKFEKDGDDFEISLPEMPELGLEIPKEEDSSSSSGPKLYVRDDGTVDWDGALQDRAALKQFGGAVWARINGQNADEIPEDEDVEATQGHSGHEKKAVTVQIEDTPEITKARDELNDLKERLADLQNSHTALVKSGISAGQAVANVNLASVNQELRTKIRVSAAALNNLEEQVSFQKLVYELERIYTYLASELGNSGAKGYVPLQDRLNVAEYGLLESQIESCHRDLEVRGSIDEDILAVISEQMTDFKRRLGIDYYVSGLTYDKEAIQTWVNDILLQTKNGIGFYIKGCRLLWNDVLYSGRLTARAAQGYTLQPREVRYIRRTFKDIITFIPFIIIWLIPLTPIGHVFVFGAIQRFFPDFFPSGFTEQRQNLLQLYETSEFSDFTVNENLSERFSRFLEAAGFIIVNRSRMIYIALMGQPQTTSSDDDKK